MLPVYELLTSMSLFFNMHVNIKLIEKHIV